jgi:GH24 family phage-related lysozyme (muramidase)
MSNFEKQRREMLKNNEGCIPHMYLDSIGNVTVAVGQLLPKAKAAVALTFRRRDNGLKATPEEIRKDYQTVAAAPRGQVASSYKRYTQLDMPEEAMDALLDKRIAEFEQALRGEFLNYNAYPESARLGLMDMVFNLGLQKLRSLFPIFIDAVSEEDWATCAQECHRRGVSEARNTMTRRLFEDAAEVSVGPSSVDRRSVVWVPPVPSTLS